MNKETVYCRNLIADGERATVTGLFECVDRCDTQMELALEIGGVLFYRCPKCESVIAKIRGKNDV